MEVKTKKEKDVRAYIKICAFVFMVVCFAAAAQLFFLGNTQSVRGASTDTSTEVHGVVSEDDEDFGSKNIKNTETNINEKKDKKDTDLDGIPDYFEDLFLCLNSNDRDHLKDLDNDSLLNVQEYFFGTNPCLFDTDGGGVGDGDEIKGKTLPNDKTDDFVMTIPNDSVFPSSFRTEPFLVEKPSPLKQEDVDYDKDDISDEIEIRFGLNPRDIKDGKKDKDRDSLSNVEEFLYGTLIDDTDTDKDGLSDGDEILVYKTNPLSYDTDGDGISDGEEIVITKTNPALWDSNLNGLSDYSEKKLLLTNLEKLCSVNWSGFVNSDSYLVNTDLHEITSFPNKKIKIPINCSVSPESFDIKTGEEEFFINNNTKEQKDFFIDITASYNISNNIISITPVFQKTTKKETFDIGREEIIIRVVKPLFVYETAYKSNNFFTSILNKVFHKTNLSTKKEITPVSNSRIIIYERVGTTWQLTKKIKPVHYTDENGLCFLMLKPGKYTIRSEKKGYKTWQSMAIQIDKKSVLSVSIPMKKT